MRLPRPPAQEGWPCSSKAGDTSPATIEDAREALQAFRPKGTAFGMLMGAVGLPSGANAPFPTLGLRVEAWRTEFAASPGTPTWTPDFVEQELRAFVGLGISAPDGYDWSNPG